MSSKTSASPVQTATRKKERNIPISGRLNSSEHGEQAAFFQMVRLLEDKFPVLKLCFSIPNGSAKRVTRNPTTGVYYSLEGQKAVREGLRAGIPDIFCAVPLTASGSRPDYGCCGLWIEMKRKGSRTSAEQVEYAALLQNFGYEYEVCYSAQEAWAVLRRYLSGSVDLPDWA